MYNALIDPPPTSVTMAMQAEPLVHTDRPQAPTNAMPYHPRFGPQAPNMAPIIGGLVVWLTVAMLTAAGHTESPNRRLRILVQRAERGDFNALETLMRETTPAQLIAALRDPSQWTARPGTRIRGRSIGAGRVSPFILKVPETYTPERQWPLHISLHGGGRTPEVNCDQHWNMGLVEHGIVLMCPGQSGGHWRTYHGELAILGALNEARKRVRIDTRRISIGGASMGGQGTWQMAARYPWLWRAALPRCGPLPESVELLRNVGHRLPMYVLHGADDKRVPVSRSRKARDILQTVHANLRYEELPGIGHGFMRERNPDVVRWLLQQPPRMPQASFTYRLMPKRQRPQRVHWLRIRWGHNNTARTSQEIQATLTSATAACDGLSNVSCLGLNWVALTLYGRRPTHITVLLPEPLWEPDKPLRLEYNGRAVFEGHVQPSVRAVLESWRNVHDPDMLTPWAVDIPFDAIAAAPQHPAPHHRAPIHTETP